MPGTGEYLVIGAIAGVVTFVSTPLVACVARRMDWVVEPDERRVHKVVTPMVNSIGSKKSQRKQLLFLKNQF